MKDGGSQPGVIPHGIAIFMPSSMEGQFTMCGRYSLVCIDDLGNRFRIHDPTIGFRSRFNVAPSQEMPVIIMSDSQRIVPMRWGLMLHGARDAVSGVHPFNARIETLSEKPAFRNLLADRRCLVPASGFFEWKQEGKRKIPFYLHHKKQPIFTFAGLYDTWTSTDGHQYHTYTIITTAATGPAARIHDRMPVILNLADEGSWLSKNPLSFGDLPGFISDSIGKNLEVYPVSDRVNNVRNDDESVIRPLAGIGM